MNIAGDRLKKLREEKRKTLQQMAHETGLTASAISNYENGIRLPRLEQLDILTNYFNVDTDYILGKRDIRNTSNLSRDSDFPQDGVSIPVKTNSSYVSTAIVLPSELISFKQGFAQILEDGSMEPKLQKGDLLIFQETPKIESGKIGFFNLNGKFYCRRLKQLTDDSYWLMADNPDYDPIPIKPEDKFETLGLYQLKITQ